MSAPFGQPQHAPLALTAASLAKRDLDALRLVGSFGFRRGRGGYYARAGARISLKRADFLIEKGLLRIDAGELALTGIGRWTVQVADERKARRS